MTMKQRMTTLMMQKSVLVDKLNMVTIITITMITKLTSINQKILTKNTTVKAKK